MAQTDFPQARVAVVRPGHSLRKPTSSGACPSWIRSLQSCRHGRHRAPWSGPWLRPSVWVFYTREHL